MEVPTLKQFSMLSLTEYLITEKCTCGVVTMQWLNLIRQLDQGSWGDASECLLDRMVKFYSRKVTPIIMEALVPINAKDLYLKKCPLVTEDCLNKIMNRCNDLRTLNLKSNCHLKFDNMELFNNNFKESCKLTTVVLEGCPQVQDGNIKALLKNAPLLVSLNVSSCKITDKASVVNGVPSHFNNYECKLEAVNLRFCETFSNTGVHHLCSLCGSTLQSIDLFKTKVDCTALLYLSGFGLDEAENFLNAMRDVTDEEYERSEIFFQAKIKNLSVNNCILQTENVAHRCFQQFLRSNRNVSCLRFYCFFERENYITDAVLKLIGDHAQNLQSLTVVNGVRMTTSGIARLAQCKKLAQIELIDSDTIEDSGIIELVQKLNLSHIKLSVTRVTRASLNAIAAKNMPDLLKELEVSWCENLQNDTVGLHNVIRSSKSLEKLQISTCRVLSTTLSLLSENCHKITELIFDSETDISDEDFILLFKSLRLLEKIFMGPSSGLTDKSIEALLTHSRHLNNVHLYCLNVTLAPFLQIITVPDELKKCLTNFVNKKILSHKVNLGDFNIELSELPCLPHRSRVYGTELRKLCFSNCDFVKEEELEMLAALAQGSLKITTRQSFEVEGSVASLKRFIQAQILHILEELPGFEKNYTFFNPGYFDSLLHKLAHLFRIFKQYMYWLLRKLGF